MSEEICNRNFCLKPGYVSRWHPQYFKHDTQGIAYQPYVYRFATYLAERFRCRYLIDLSKLYPFEKWLEDGPDNPDINISKELLRESIIVCRNVIEHLVDPSYLLSNIKKFMDYAPVCLLSTPERDLTHGQQDFGPPANPTHVREWNLKEFKELLLSFDLNLEHTGLTFSNNRSYEKKTILSVIGKNNNRIKVNSMGNFNVLAIIAAFNEEDIIFHSIKHLINQGIYVYVIDNWSTDSTYEITKKFNGKDYFLGCERYPPESPGQFFNLKDLLRRKEELAMKVNADWFINADVDEIRESPWPGINLKEGLYHVDRLGFNAIDHSELTFYPVDNDFESGADYESYFRYCAFTPLSASYFHVKAWKNTGSPVCFHHSAGHVLSFDGLKVFPYKFLLKHYPIRSQRHGEKKIFVNRKPRYAPEERSMGWHIHYDNYKDGCSFIRRPEDLELFNENFYSKYLVERLAGTLFG